MVGAGYWDVARLCAASAGLTGLLCYHAAGVGRVTQLMDKPDGVRKLHKTETPLIGGLAALIPTFVVSLLYSAGVPLAPVMLIAVGAATAMLVIGIIDDRANLSPVWRIVALTFIVFTVFSISPLFVLHTLRFGLFGSDFSVPLGDPIAAPVIALFIVGFVNAANMADGMNGQLLGSVMIWSAFIIYYLGVDVGVPFIVLICSALVTFIYNLRGRLFAGNSGAYAASLFVALGAIAAYRLSNGAMPAEVPVFWFWLPVLDCLRLMVNRVLNGRSPFAGDRNHFHHMLMNHMRVRYALIVYLGLLAAPGAAAIVNRDWASAVLLMCIGCYGALLVVKRVATLRVRDERPASRAVSFFSTKFSRMAPSKAGRPTAKVSLTATNSQETTRRAG
ncbi:MAG: glycosyltransferase family 4 protein [Rhizomicrobium sp.]